MDIEIGDHVRIMADDGETLLAEGAADVVIPSGTSQDIGIAVEGRGIMIRAASIAGIDLAPDGVYVVHTSFITLEHAPGFVLGCGCSPRSEGEAGDTRCGCGGCSGPCDGNCQCDGH